MTNRFPPPASNTRRTDAGHRPAQRRRAFAALLSSLVLTLAAAPRSAGEESAPALRPYTAQYKTTARGLDMELTRKLKGSEGNYVLTSGGKLMVVGFHEISVFTVEGDRVLPRSYIYRGTGLIRRRRELHFEEAHDTIRSLHKDTWYDLPFSEDTQDRMSQLVQLRLLLLNEAGPPHDITMQVADGKRVKQSRLVFVDNELVQTPLGPVETVHFERLHQGKERKSDVWLAPGWDYLMVKTVHIEDGKPVEVLLTSATIEGEQIGID